MRLQNCGICKVLIIGQSIVILIMFLVLSEMKNDSALFQGEFSRDLERRTHFVKETNGKSQNSTGETKLNYSERQNTSLATVTRKVNNKRSVQFQKKDKFMTDRLSMIREKCSHYMEDPYWQNFRQQGTVLTYEEKNIHYCIVPKVGCTFWKRIMRFLGKDYPVHWNIQRPSDIDRNYVHYGPINSLKKWSVQNPISQMLMTKGESFMFVRDPFTRLWSAYIDKFLLPDFWRSDALVVVKILRPNATDYEKYCPIDVTFREFLTYINRTYKTGLNEHWQRLHRVCSPCHVQYDVIGKQESFGSDADYILTKFNLEYLKENTTKLNMVHEEVTTLTKYNFDLETAIREECFDKIDVARRLWLAFQYNGYIDRHTGFPKSDLLKTEFLKSPNKIFIDLVLKTIENQDKIGVNIKGQKRAMMLEAYKKIPKNLLKDIISVYEYDFDLFGYNRTLFGDLK